MASPDMARHNLISMGSSKLTDSILQGQLTMLQVKPNGHLYLSKAPLYLSWLALSPHAKLVIEILRYLSCN
jgi:hypothetical protein